MPRTRLTADLRNSRAAGGKTASAKQRFLSTVANEAQEGNKRLREMSPMRARTLCRSELSGNAEARQKYKEWCEGFEDGLRFQQRLSFEKERHR